MILRKIIHTTITEFLNEKESIQTEKRFVIDKKNHKFQLFLGDTLATESQFNIEKSDKWFNQKYVTIFDLKTVESFQGKGLAKYLLENIFDYVKNKLKLNIITLMVYKNNNRAVNLYFNSGFEIYQNFDGDEPCFILIKKL
jgi:ribosomal protein S18 acetylase RimI-like enzyme